MKVHFANLAVTTKQIKKEYLRAVKNLLEGSRFILTAEVDQFEKSFARSVGTKYCVGVSSGADALYLSLVSLGIGARDEVIIQGNAYNASVTAILRTGAVPRFVDIHPETLCLDETKIEKRITKRTKAILPVHLYGQPNDLDTIMRIAKRHKLFVVEDCAQSHGASWDGKTAGSFGDAGAFSFYPTKNLGAFGDAGAIVTDRKDLYAKILALRNLGQVGKDNHYYLGYNMRLDPIQAIALTRKLNFLGLNTQKRQEAAAYYDSLIRKYGLPAVISPNVHPYATHVYHLYVVRIVGYNRDMLVKQLQERGVETAVHYPVPVYRQPFYKNCKRFRDDCPVTDATARSILSLPIFPGISQREQEYVIQSLARVICQ